MYDNGQDFLELCDCTAETKQGQTVSVHRSEEIYKKKRKLTNMSNYNKKKYAVTSYIHYILYVVYIVDMKQELNKTWTSSIYF